MQRLLCLGLEGQPAAELIAGTAKVWQERLGQYGADRLSRAFDAVEESAKRWPTPADVIACLPAAIQAPMLPQRVLSDSEREKNKQRIAEMIGGMFGPRGETK